MSHVAEQVWRNLHPLVGTGPTHDTLIIFTSDHGEHLGDLGQVRKGPPGLGSCARSP
ncbi:MAG: hypothetical protein JJU36_10800 [Phycisphaeraceae bacterium]|nr:hypothetical protein [Phycisphaeraceae bacterium]